MPECVEPFADLGISTLSEVLDPVELGKHLRVFSSPPWQWGSIQDVSVRPVKRHAGRRCTVEINLRTEGGCRSLIGKVYAADRSDVYLAMEEIRRAGFGPQDEFSIPQPLIFLSSLRLLLQEKVEGPLAQEILIAGNGERRAAAAERCARWLARFHAVAPRPGTVLCLDRYLSSMQRWSCRIAELGEPFAGKAARLLQRLEVAASSESRVKMRAGHGSYSAAQIILAEGHTVAFDWDGYDVADPARDVARFLIALRRLALARLGSIGALDAAADVFLRTYITAGQPEVMTNLRFYKAAVCLQLAKYNIHHPVRGWHEKMEAMLDEGLRVLQQETSR